MTNRLHVSDGKAYLIRDVWDNGRFVNCEYGVLIDGGIRWTPCREGVAFSEIEPFMEVFGLTGALDS